MLGEVALTPDVFSATSCDDSQAFGVYLQLLKEPLLQEVMVRNLCAGEWYRCFSSPERQLSQRGKELLRKLSEQKRLRTLSACLSANPNSDHDWCLEALASNRADPLECIVTTAPTKTAFAQETVVTRLEQICSHPWWLNRASSVRLCRTTEDYRKRLSRLLCCANSVMFLDPHLDPSEKRYSEFWRLLECASRQVAPVRVEIHRVCRKRDSRERGGWRIVRNDEWESIFNTHLRPKLINLSLKAEVFIWDDFHDRYLISDLMGISIPNGFDIDNSTNNLTTWNRLARSTRDDIQREFSPEAKRHSLIHRFQLIP